MNLAIFMPNWIGDAVMATPAVRTLRQRFRGARITAVLRPYVADVFAGSPWLDQLIFLAPSGPRSQRWPAVVSRLRRERIDLAVLFPNSFRSAWVAWLGRCRRRVGYPRHGRSLFLTDSLDVECDARGRQQPSPIVDAYNRLAAHAGCQAPERRLELFTTPDDETAADLVWAKHGFDSGSQVVCLNPGAAFGSAKHWPVEAFAELARLLRAGQVEIMVLCGPGERELARAIARLAGGPPVASLADHDLSVGLTKACVRAALLVTTDSGPRHFATAFGRPVVTLFGPTHIAWTETFHPLGVHLQKQVGCGPCQLRVCPLDHRCMTLLTPEEVCAASVRLLERAESQALAGNFPFRPALAG